MSKVYRVLLLVGLLAITGLSFGLSISNEGSCQASELDAAIGGKAWDAGLQECVDGGGSCRSFTPPTL